MELAAGGAAAHERCKSLSTTAPAPTTTTPDNTAAEPVITLLIENPGKGKNWGPLLRCCAAFGIGTIYVVGYDRCDVRGSHGASKHVELRAFPTHEQAAAALATNRSTTDTGGTTTTGTGGGGFELVGLLPPLPEASDGTDCATDDDIDDDRKVVRETFFYEPTEKEMEIVRIAPPCGGCSGDERTTDTERAAALLDATVEDKRSFPVHRRSAFPKRTCLVVDKVRRGLPWPLAKHCASFVHIPHANYNPNGSMLTLEASVSIVFHEAMNAGLVGYTDSSSAAAAAAAGAAEASANNNESNDNETTHYEGQKYHVEKIHKGGNPNDIQARQRKRKEREEKMKELKDEADQDGQHPSLFGDANDDGDY